MRVVLTTPWGKKGYKPRTLRQIESYYVDTALDNDSDPFSVEIGDPDGDLIKTLKRDNEVRVQIFGVGSKARGVDYLLTGIADEISYSEQGVLRINGRDLSSIATDSVVPPKQYRHVRAYKIVEQQARELGIGGRMNLHHSGIVKKAQYTDGSETYWEFWHRLYRKEQMWIWMGPSGMLNAKRLNYDAAPSYFFGKPRTNDSSRIKNLYQPVESCEIRKTTQGRVGEVWVYGHKGDNGFLVIANDPTTRKWVKRPRKIIFDRDAHTRKAAQKTAWEEIFEGKVGSIEIVLSIGDPGWPVRVNRMARLRIPEMNLFGDYFVVGTRIQAGPNGYVQEIRLREKAYALSHRIPPDPKQDTGQPSKKDANVAGTQLDVPWADAFVKAAREHHGPWNFQLFLATLLAICDQETSFKNVRNYGGSGEEAEWYRWERESGTRGAGRDPDDPAPVGNTDRFGRTYDEWKQIFRNENPTYAVGPMQLYSQGYKWWADDYLKLGNRNQFTGGRWHPECNIRAAARALRNKLQLAVRDSGRDIDMWAGVSYYGHHYAGESPNKVPTRYAVEVKNKVYNNPGYLQEVKSTFEDVGEQAKEDAKNDPASVRSRQGKGEIIGTPYQGTHHRGQNWESMHAWDVALPIGTKITSPIDGRIGGSFGYDSRGGWRLHVMGANGREVYMAHLSRYVRGLRPGKRVAKGEVIAYSGDTGNAKGTEPHLHVATNPSSWDLGSNLDDCYV